MKTPRRDLQRPLAIGFPGLAELSARCAAIPNQKPVVQHAGRTKVLVNTETTGTYQPVLVRRRKLPTRPPLVKGAHLYPELQQLV